MELTSDAPATTSAPASDAPAVAAPSDAAPTPATASDTGASSNRVSAREMLGLSAEETPSTAPTDAGAADGSQAHEDPQAASAEDASKDDASGDDVSDEDAPFRFSLYEGDDADKYADFAFVGRDGTTKYRTPEEWAIGTQHKDDTIARQKQTLAEMREAVQEREARIAQLEGLRSPEDLRADLVEGFLPEEYRGKTEDDFFEAADLRRFVLAQAKAEEQADAALVEQQTAAARERAEYDTDLAEGHLFVQDVATKAFLSDLADDDEVLVRHLSALTQSVTVTGAEGEPVERPLNIVQQAGLLYAHTKGALGKGLAEQSVRLLIDGVRARVDAERRAQTEKVRTRTREKSATRGSVATPAAASGSPPPAMPSRAVDYFR